MSTPKEHNTIFYFNGQYYVNRRLTTREIEEIVRQEETSCSLDGLLETEEEIQMFLDIVKMEVSQFWTLKEYMTYMGEKHGSG